MIVELLALCSAAHVTPDGALSILNIFDTAAAPELPIKVLCSMASKIRLAPDEPGQVEVRVRLRNEDLEDVVPEMRNRSELPEVSDHDLAALWY